MGRTSERADNFAKKFLGKYGGDKKAAQEDPVQRMSSQYLSEKRKKIQAARKRV